MDEFTQHLLRAHEAIVGGGVDMTPAELVLAYEQFAPTLFCECVDGKIVAHAEIHRSRVPHRWCISTAVEREHQGKGLGRLVTTKAVEWADEQRIDHLDGYAWSHNERSLRMYRSLGFESLGVIPDAYRRGGESYTQIILSRRGAWH